MSAFNNLASLFVPEVAIESLRIQFAQDNKMINGQIVYRDPQYDQAASGLGKTVKIVTPDVALKTYETQAEGVNATPKKIGAIEQNVPILNRVLCVGTTALARAIGMPDPLKSLYQVITASRTADLKGTIMSVLKGVAKSRATPGDPKDFAGIILDLTNNTGTGGVVDTTSTIRAAAKTGVLRGKFNQIGCQILMHGDILTTLTENNPIEFVKPSDNEASLGTWMRMEVVQDDGKVTDNPADDLYYLKEPALDAEGDVIEGKYTYYTILMAPGSFPFGEKPQSVADEATGVDVASLGFKASMQNGDAGIYDRRRYLAGATGASFAETNAAPAVGSSYTNAELEAARYLPVIKPALSPFVILITNG